MEVTEVGWTCSRSPILPRGKRPAGGEGEQDQRLVAGEREPQRLEQPVEPSQDELLDPHQRGDRVHLGTPSQCAAHCRAASSIGSNGSGIMGAP